MTAIDPQVASIGIAFCELAKMLGKNDVLQVTQLARVLETRAKVAKANELDGAVLDALARWLRDPTT